MLIPLGIEFTSFGMISNFSKLRFIITPKSFMAGINSTDLIVSCNILSSNLKTNKDVSKTDYEIEHASGCQKL